MARGLWINAAPWEHSLVKFHLSQFRIWKEFSPCGNRGSGGLSAVSDENLRYLVRKDLLRKFMTHIFDVLF